jgi:thioredoxin-like negative regulator of GroEL
MSESSVDVPEWTAQQLADFVALPDSTVVVVFVASWSTTSCAMLPVIHEVVRDAGSTIRLGIVDIEQHAAARAYGIVQVPTILRFDTGTVSTRHNGPLGRRELRTLVHGRLT